MSATQQIADFLKKGVPLFYTNTQTGQLMSFNDVEKSVTPLKNAVLEEFLQPGDIVMMNAEADKIREEVPNGTFGVVTGHYRYRRALGYHELIFAPAKDSEGVGIPGIYERSGAAQIAWINGETTQGHAGDIYNVTDDRGWERENSNAFHDIHSMATLVGPLPVLNLWPGDTVGVIDERRALADGFHSYATIERIDYNDVGEKCEDGSPLAIYEIRPQKTGSGSMMLREYLDVFTHPGSDSTVNKLIREIPDDIYISKMTERGNFWKWFNGKRSEMKFHDVFDSFDFLMRLGLLEQVKASEGGYIMRRPEIEEKFAAGVICYVRPANFKYGLEFPANPTYEGWTIPNNAEIREKVRKEIAVIHSLTLPSEAAS